MNAGRELDALVAEKVMGIPPLEIIRRANGDFDEIRGWPECPIDQSEEDAYGALDKPGGKNLIFWFPKTYSTSIADAWLVVEKMGSWHGFTFMVFHEKEWRRDRDSEALVWRCGWFEWGWDGPESRAASVADTAPLAICLAALKACGVELESLKE